MYAGLFALVGEVCGWIGVHDVAEKVEVGQSHHMYVVTVGTLPVIVHVPLLVVSVCP